MSCPNPYAAGVTRVGTLKRITTETTFPVPGTGFRYAAYNFRVSLSGLLAGSNPILEVFSTTGSARLSLIPRTNSATTLTRQKLYFDGPIWGDNNAVMVVRVFQSSGPWQAEFFLSVVPIPI